MEQYEKFIEELLEPLKEGKSVSKTYKGTKIIVSNYEGVYNLFAEGHSVKNIQNINDIKQYVERIMVAKDNNHKVMDTLRPVPEAIYSEDGEYLKLHSQGPEFSIYEDLDGLPISIDNEYAWSQSAEDNQRTSNEGWSPLYSMSVYRKPGFYYSNPPMKSMNVDLWNRAVDLTPSTNGEIRGWKVFQMYKRLKS